MIIISKDPTLSVHFLVQNNKIQKVELLPDTQFTCRIEGDQTLNREILSWLKSYAQKKHPHHSLPLEPAFQGFTKHALDVLQTIPFGETLTYKQVAEKMANPKASRAVGNSCHVNPYPLIVPCHRVIRTGGKTGGFAYGSLIKQILLTFESTP